MHPCVCVCTYVDYDTVVLCTVCVCSATAVANACDSSSTMYVCVQTLSVAFVGSVLLLDLPYIRTYVRMYIYLVSQVIIFL